MKKKWIGIINRLFKKENIKITEITNKHMKKCSTLLVISKM